MATLYFSKKQLQVVLMQLSGRVELDPSETNLTRAELTEAIKSFIARPPLLVATKKPAATEKPFMDKPVEKADAPAGKSDKDSKNPDKDSKKPDKDPDDDGGDDEGDDGDDDDDEEERAAPEWFQIDLIATDGADGEPFITREEVFEGQDVQNYLRQVAASEGDRWLTADMFKVVVPPPDALDSSLTRMLPTEQFERHGLYLMHLPKGGSDGEDNDDEDNDDEDPKQDKGSEPLTFTVQKEVIEKLLGAVVSDDQWDRLIKKEVFRYLTDILDDNSDLRSLVRALLLRDSEADEASAAAADTEFSTDLSASTAVATSTSRAAAASTSELAQSDSLPK